MVFNLHAARIRHLPSHLLPAQMKRMYGVTAPGRKSSGESLLRIRPEMNCRSFTGRHSQSEQWVSFLTSSKVCCVFVCVQEGENHTHKVSPTLSHTRLTRLSASGSPYYINGKCSVKDNTHMVGCDERWHPARD